MMDESGSSLVRRGLTTAAFLSEGILLQLGLIFLLSPARADPFVVGPPIALYAVRESDRSVVGTALYVAPDRMDIRNAVRILCQSMKEPT